MKTKLTCRFFVPVLCLNFYISAIHCSAENLNARNVFADVSAEQLQSKISELVKRSAPNERAATLKSVVNDAFETKKINVGKIVEVVCQVAPNDYRTVAIEAAKIAPDAKQEILDAVCLALPEKKSAIKVSLLAYSGNITSVADVLDQANSIPQTQAAPGSATVTTLAAAPGRPALLPAVATPASIAPAKHGEVPTKDRKAVTP